MSGRCSPTGPPWPTRSPGRWFEYRTPGTCRTVSTVSRLKTLIAVGIANEHRDKLHRSVFTEPHGAVYAMCHLLTDTGAKQRIHIWTDSVTTMVAGNKGFNARSEDVNACVLRLNKLFPLERGFTFKFGFISGKMNVVADKQSRALRVTWADLEGGAAQLQALNSL